MKLVPALVLVPREFQTTAIDLPHSYLDMAPGLRNHPRTSTLLQLMENPCGGGFDDGSSPHGIRCHHHQVDHHQVAM